MKVIVLQLESKREEELLESILQSFNEQLEDESEKKYIQYVLETLSSEESSIMIDGKVSESRIRKITVFLNELGIPINLKGFHYIRESIIIMLDDENEKDIGVTKSLYPKLSKKFKTPASCVERNIRHAIESTWKRGNKKLIERIWGCNIFENKIRPTNSEFLARVVDYIKLEENEK